MVDGKNPTHTAFALRRYSKRHGTWLEIGTGRQDSNGAFHAVLDRLPVGGFNGYVYFAPIGAGPPEDLSPTRPGPPVDEDGDLG